MFWVLVVCMLSEFEIIKNLKKWNLWGEYRINLLNRDLYVESMKKNLCTENILVVLGVRRAGKSALTYLFAKNLIEHKTAEEKDFLFINFEDPFFANLDAKDLEQIYNVFVEEINPGKKHFVILDEVHECNRWELFINTLAEARKVNVIITGSNSKILEDELSYVISGRYLTLKVFPLSFSEYLDFLGEGFDKKNLLKNASLIKQRFKKYLFFGGYPKYVLTNDSALLKNYFDTILYKDIVIRYKIKKARELELLAKYYASNFATITSLNNLSKTLKLSKDTLERFSTYFEKSYLFFFIKKFDFSKRTQILSQSKVYIIDTGLSSFVGFTSHEKIGQHLENMVFITLLKKYGLENIFYWKDYDERECDFIVHDFTGKKIKAIQVAAELNNENRKRELSGLMKALDNIKQKEGLILTSSQEEIIKRKDKKIFVKPVYKWLLENINQNSGWNS